MRNEKGQGRSVDARLQALSHDRDLSVVRPVAAPLGARERLDPPGSPHLGVKTYVQTDPAIRRDPEASAALRESGIGAALTIKAYWQQDLAGAAVA